MHKNYFCSAKETRIECKEAVQGVLKVWRWVNKFI